MFHQPWIAVCRLVLLLLAGILLMSCGTAQTSDADAVAPTIVPTTAVATTPEDVHAQYIQAAATNDRQTVLRLTVSEERVAIGTTMELFSRYVAGSEFLVPGAGTFVDAAPIALVNDGKGKIGLSLWRWEHAQLCFQTQLVETDAGWQVGKWYRASPEQVQQYTQCADSTTK